MKTVKFHTLASVAVLGLGLGAVAATPAQAQSRQAFRCRPRPGPRAAMSPRSCRWGKGEDDARISVGLGYAF